MKEADIEQLVEFQTHGQDIGTLLEHWAEHRPEHPALVWDPRAEAVRSWTYAELLADVRRLAAGLSPRGITRGDKVLIHSDNCPKMVLAWLACAVLGAVAVTTNTKSVTEEIAFYATKADCIAAITQPQYATTVFAAAPQLAWIAVIEPDAATPTDDPASTIVRFTDLAAPNARDWPGRPIEPMLPFGIMFTSGTTNRPKAVVHTHATAVWAGANADAFEDGWFKTGDMVTMGTGGNVFYLERDKDLLKVGGENVSAREVEGVVATVPGVGQVAVVGKRHEFLDQVVVAFVITTAAAPDAATLEQRIVTSCTERLAAFKVPRAVYVVDEFPTGLLDKLLKNQLRDLADAQPPV